MISGRGRGNTQIVRRVQNVQHRGRNGRSGVRRPVSTPSFEESVEVAVLGLVVGDVVLPAAPEDAGPGAAEDADGVGVVGAAVERAVVDVARPGVPVAGGGGRGAAGGFVGVFCWPRGG